MIPQHDNIQNACLVAIHAWYWLVSEPNILSYSLIRFSVNVQAEYDL